MSSLKFHKKYINENVIIVERRIYFDFLFVITFYKIPRKCEYNFEIIKHMPMQMHTQHFHTQNGILPTLFEKETIFEYLNVQSRL